MLWMRYTTRHESRAAIGKCSNFGARAIHDEGECEMSITEFMADAQERNDIVD